MGLSQLFNDPGECRPIRLGRCDPLPGGQVGPLDIPVELRVIRRAGHRDHLVVPAEHGLEVGAAELTPEIVFKKERGPMLGKDALDELGDLCVLPVILVGKPQSEPGPVVLDPENPPSGPYRDEVCRVGDLGCHELVPARLRSLHPSLHVSPFIEDLINLAPGDHAAQ